MNQNQNSGAKPWIWISLIVFLLAVASIWLMRPSPVVMDEDGYQVAMALYKVCNQRNEAGLDQIEERLSDMEPESQQVAALELVLSDARSGEWESALEDCRKLLDDQVDR